MKKNKSELINELNRFLIITNLGIIAFFSTTIGDITGDSIIQIGGSILVTIVLIITIPLLISEIFSVIFYKTDNEIENEKPSMKFFRLVFSRYIPICSYFIQILSFIIFLISVIFVS